ncbi:MAG: secretion protein [Hydrogenophilales bacterium 12-64-13]|nr:MAG: secretion protein [Hydrogenophilales bacterium 12-64-13]
MKTSLVLPLLLASSLAHAVTVEPPPAPGQFWLKLDALPDAAPRAAPAADTLRFDSLAALTSHALAQRAESRAVWLGIQAEAARLDASRADLWPTLTGQFGFTRSQSLSSSGASVPVLHRYGPSLSLAWVLYDFGARAAGIEAQRYQLIASLLAGNRSLQDIVTEVETGWAAWVAARGGRDAQDEQVKALQTSFDAVAARVAGGLASRADQLRARAALAEAVLARDAAVRDFAKAEAALRQAAGIPQTQTLVLDWDTVPAAGLDDTTLLADLLAEAERQRPDVLALRATAARARAEAEAARASRWPSLALNASAGRTFFLEDERTPSSTNSVGLTLSVPLFDGGRLADTARAARRSAEQAEAQAAAQRETIALDVVNAYQDARYAQTARAGVVSQFESSDESSRAAEARYRAGVGSLLEWLTAQADRARARQAQAQAESDWLAALSRLNHALGRLPPALTER